MEEVSTIVASATKEMDKMLAGVMPRSWAGHGRLKVWEADDLSDKQRSKALEAVDLFKEENPDMTGLQAANAVIPAIKEKYE